MTSTPWPGCSPDRCLSPPQPGIEPESQPHRSLCQKQSVSFASFSFLKKSCRQGRILTSRLPGQPLFNCATLCLLVFDSICLTSLEMQAKQRNVLNYSCLDCFLNRFPRAKQSLLRRKNYCFWNAFQGAGRSRIPNHIWVGQLHCQCFGLASRLSRQLLPSLHQTAFSGPLKHRKGTATFLQCPFS